MTKREIASMILKLAGLLAVVKYISFVPMMVGAIITLFASKGDVGNAFTSLMYMLGSLFYPVCCVFLIIYSDKFAAKLFPEDKMVQISTSMSKDEIMSIAFTCIGLLVIAGAIPEFINLATTYTITDGAGRQWQRGNIPRLVAAIVKLVIGCWCFLGAKGIVNLRYKIKGNVGSQEDRS